MLKKVQMNIDLMNLTAYFFTLIFVFGILALPALREISLRRMEYEALLKINAFQKEKIKELEDKLSESKQSRKNP
jgi:hypothetical protein